MISSLISQLELAILVIKTNLPTALTIVMIFVAAQILNMLTGYRLNILGIYPRHIFGLVGIIFSPFLHANFNHLFFNLIPLFVLLNFVLMAGFTKFIAISFIIILLSGTATWLFGRRALHIGASGLVMGYWGFLLINAYRHPSVITLILAVICIYYFGGLVFSLFPSQEKVSWEGHVFGFLAGLVAAVII